MATRIQNHVAILEIFFSGGWDESILKKYYQTHDSLITTQIFMPVMNSKEATRAFNVDKEIKGLNWVIHYKGMVRAPKAGTFRLSDMEMT